MPSNTHLVLLCGFLAACETGSTSLEAPRDDAAETLPPAGGSATPEPGSTPSDGTTPSSSTDVPSGSGGSTTTTDIGGALLDLEVVPPGGAFVGEVEVELTTTDADAVIWYTLDGTPPVPGEAMRYDGPFVLDRSASVRALAEHSFGQVSMAAPTFLRLEPDAVDFSSNLPLVVAWSQEGAPTERREVYDAFTLTVVEPAPERASLLAEPALSVRSGLKVRGSSSSWYPKKPYRIETWGPLDDEDMDVALLGMPAEADWVLLAPLDFDRAFMRNALVYDLSNRIGRYAPRTRFVELFVAEDGEDVGLDDYVGIYVVVERIERDAERVPITRLEPTDLALPEVSGGYLFKEDRTGPGEVGFWAGDADGTFDFESPFVYVDPGEQGLPEPQRQYLTDLLDDLGHALASDDFRSPHTGRHYDAMIDVDAWIDHHILNVLSKNPDAFRLSAYFHKDRGGLLQAGPVWDFDRTMGCASDGRAADPTWWDNSNETDDCSRVFDHGFWRGLFDDPVFRIRYFSRLAVLLDGALSEGAMLFVVASMEAELAEAAPRNYDRWPDYGPRDGSFDAEIDLLESWLIERQRWMSGCLELPDPRDCIGG